MSSATPNSDVGALTPPVMVFGGKDLQKSSGVNHCGFTVGDGTHGVRLVPLSESFLPFPLSTP